LPSEAPKAPEIPQTSPPAQREGHEKYSVEASTAIRATSAKTWEGGVQRRIDLLAESMAKKTLRFLPAFLRGRGKTTFRVTFRVEG